MIITHKLKIDLMRQEQYPPVSATQGDTYSRAVEISLYSGGAPWNLPNGHDIVIRYCKPDGTTGIYDTLPDGSVAWSTDGNTVSVMLCPQMLTCPGKVSAQVSIIVGDQIISTFTFWVFVEQDPCKGAMKSESYNNWRKAFMPQTTGAKVGQYLQITKVDAEGRVIEVKPVDAPAAGGIDGDLDMQGEMIDNIGTLSFAGPDGTAANGAWLGIDDVVKSGDGIVSPVISHYSNDNDDPVIYRGIAPGVEDRDAANVGQIKTRLPAPLKASVGQYIQITAVDKNGAVTAVEGVNAPSGGGGADEVFVKLEDGSVVPAEIFIDPDDPPADYIPAPMVAAVGQTVVVEQINAAGVPTKWRPADLPSIPDALPNPQPLTIGGQSYDGSTAVSVNLPAGGGGGNVHFTSQDFTLPEDANGFDIQLPVPAKNLIMYNLIITKPHYDTSVENSMVYALHGGNNIALTNVTTTGSLNISGLRFGDYVYVTVTSRKQDQYYEHTYPALGSAENPSGRTILGEGDKITLVNMTEGVFFPSGTQVKFWGVYFNENL